jgi:hypothetical protein
VWKLDKSGRAFRAFEHDDNGETHMKTKLLTAVLLASGALSAQAATYTILPTSTASVTGSINASFAGTFGTTPFTATGSSVLAEQAPGSLTTTLSGTIDADISGAVVSFTSSFGANNSGSWLPSGAPANFGLISSVLMDSSAPFPDFTVNVLGSVGGTTASISGSATLVGAAGNQSFSTPLGGYITSGVVDAIATPAPAYLPPMTLMVPLTNIALTGVSNGTLVSDGSIETLTIPFSMIAEFTVLVPVNANGVVGTTTLSMIRNLTGEMIAVRAVPEPETYAMLLAGLGLVGWAARRRK